MTRKEIAMLNVLRHKGVAKKVLWFTTVIIVLSFGFFGVASRYDHSNNTAGKIYGKNVSLRDFEKAYYDTRDEAIMMYGDQFFKYGDRLNLEDQTWDRLLLQREVKKRGIKTSDQEVVDFIATMPFFQTQGKFDQFKYQMIVQNPGVFNRKTVDFEDGVRSQISIKKLLEQVAGNTVPSDSELKKEYTLKNEKLKLTYALFEPLKAAKDLNISEDEMKKYYEAHQEQFRKPLMVNVESTSLNFGEKATDQQKDLVKKQIQDLAKELKKDSDFKAIAQKVKLEIKESGFFSQAQPLLTFAWSPELVEKIFAMKQGEYSPAFETPDGWMVLKLKERKESMIPSFDETKTDVKAALLTDRGFSIAQTKAEAALKVIQDGLKANKNFKDLAASQEAKVDQTPMFGRGEYIASMGIIAEFQEVTLKMNMQNRLSDVISTSQGPAIIYLDGIEAIDEKQFESDKANFKEMFQAQKKNQAIVSFLTELKLKANVQNLLENNRKKK